MYCTKRFLPINSQYIVKTSYYDIIAIQETWFTQNIDSNEIVASTQYSIIREDRSSFNNARTVGSGVVIFIKNGIIYAKIAIKEKTTLEFIAIRVYIGTTYYSVINNSIYTYHRIGTDLDYSRNFQKSFEQLKCNLRTTNLSLLLILNSAGIQWNYSDKQIRLFNTSKPSK